ncbi:hypothetical protein BASA50_007264 [Batrachochytrium salamandrivorans]|uniref:non-specific serine/threonine protein kinase n=1 Tax=Batrachochytrium salamandrivorans TaxID=1357716 RepID=A0ABQ8F7H2_9FUNG|nr:hypothetical protein BASA50_007264 [Batrachochytrium salamandrivorans]
MFDSLLWVLPHFVTHYAGQTTQGDTNDGDGVDQASGSKDAPKQDTSLPQRVYPLRLKRPLQESSTHDQSDALAPADLQPEKECGGGHRIRKISKPCSQHQSQSELQPSISHDLPQSDEMPLPVRVGESEVESYSLSWETDQYHKFTEQEAEYFESEYSFEKELGKGRSGVVSLATRKSNGLKVAYKSIPKSEVKKYELELESNLPFICHLRNPLVGSDEQSVEQCMSSRPPNLLVPHEFIIQMYLSRPGHGSPYVPKVFDYIILENEFIVVMEYFDEKWVTLFSYFKEKGRLDIDDAREIVREIVNGMISLRQHGILHDDLTGMSQ